MLRSLPQVSVQYVPTLQLILRLPLPIFVIFLQRPIYNNEHFFFHLLDIIFYMYGELIT